MADEEESGKESAPSTKPSKKRKSSSCNPVKEPLYDYDSIPTAARLTTKYKGKIDQIKATVKRPPGAYPETHLPTWPTMSMEQKIPLVEAPKNTIVISRGRLCKELLRPTKCFRTDDPLHMETIIAPPYDALHDPSAKNYLFKPVVEQTLLRQKLCNNTGQVLCSLKAFNDYRRYLNRAVYVEDVKLAIQNADAIFENQRKQYRDIQKDLSRTEGKDFLRQQKIDYARQYKEDMIRANAERLKYRTVNEAYLQESHKARLEEERECRRIQGILKDQARDERVRNLHITRINARAALMKLIADREKSDGKRLKEEMKIKQKMKNNLLLEHLENKLDAQKQKAKMDEHLDRSLTAAAQKRAEARQRKVESHRAQMPAILLRRQENEIRIWKIVRKFFDRWLAKVRARRARRPDDMHKSLWDIPTVFDGTVAYLRKESGYEKLDDFIMGIVKLKRDIKAEIEAEEAAERELAEREANEAQKSGSAPKDPAPPAPTASQNAAAAPASAPPPKEAAGSQSVMEQASRTQNSQPASPPPSSSEAPSSASMTK